MIRLYGKELKKLQHGTLVWYMWVNDSGVVSKIPCKFLEIVKKSDSFRTRLLGPGPYIIIENCQKHRNTILAFSRYRRHGPNADNGDTVFLAKVTHKEEPEFIAKLLED